MASITDLKVGDRVRSRWSGSGAVWEVTALKPREWQLDIDRVELRSTSSTRTSVRRPEDLSLI